MADISTINSTDKVVADFIPKLNGNFSALNAGLLGASNGTDDAATINAALLANSGKIVIGLAGETYRIGSTIFLPANTTLDMTGCTVLAVDGWKGYPVQAYGQKLAIWAPVTTNPTTATTGGTLAAGTYYYGVSAVTATGETMISPTKSVTTTGTTSTATITWAAPTVPAGASPITGYKIYGRGSRNLNTLLGTAAAGATSFVDTGGAGSAATIPATNTTFGRTAGIRIIGGTYDANWENRPVDFDWVSSRGYAGHCFDLQKVDDLLMRDVTVKNARKWAVAIADFGHIKTENIILDTHSDGIHVVGPGLTWTDSGGRAVTCGDDARAFSLAEWPTYAVSRGSIGAVKISDFYLGEGPSFFRGLGGDGYKLGLLQLKGLTGHYSGQFRAGIYIWDQQPANGWANGTDIDTIEISDISINMANTPLIDTPYGGGRNPCVFFGGRNLGSITMERIHAPATNMPYGVITLGRAANLDTLQTIKSMRVSQVTFTGDTIDYPILRLQDNVKVERLDVLGMVASNSAGTGSTIDIRDSAEVVHMRVAASAWIPPSAGSGQIIKTQLSGIIRNLVVENCVYAGQFRAVDIVSPSTVENITLRTNRVPTGISAGELVRINSGTVEVVLEGNIMDSLSANGAINCGASTTVTVRSAGGNKFPSSKTAAYTAATPTAVRVIGADLPHNLAMTSATKVAGDMVNNSNAALSCGAGQVITDGTTWKNLYSAATY